MSEDQRGRSHGRPRVSDLALHMHTVGVLASLGTDRPGAITTALLDDMSMDTTTAVVELELVGLWHREDDGYTVGRDELASVLRIIDDQLQAMAADCRRLGGHLVTSERPGFCSRCMSMVD